MLERGADLEDRGWRLFLPRKPKIPNLMFHIHSDSPFQIDPNLLLKEKARQINDALRKASIRFSVKDLIRGESSVRRLGLDEIENVVFHRVGRFVDGYFQAEVLSEGGYYPTVVASGDSGIHIAAAVAEATSLPDAIDLFVRESGGLAIAQGDFNRDELPDPEFPLRTRQVKVHLGDFYDVLARIAINDPIIPIVGGMGNIMTKAAEIRQEFIRQTLEPGSEKRVRATLKKLHIRKPHEIGLDNAGDDNSYLTIAASALKRKDVQLALGGAVVFGAILGYKLNKRRQKSKKA